MSEKSLEERTEQAWDQFKEDRSLELFDKHASELTSEQQKLLSQYIDDYNHEEWREVKTRKGDMVEVSSLGKVRKADGDEYVINGLPRQPFVNIKGRDGSIYPQMVNWLVATAFVPNPDHKENVINKDGHKWVNWHKNLEWADKGLAIKRIQHEPNQANHIVYSVEEIRQVCQLLQDHPDWSYQKISDETGVSMSQIKRINSGKTWVEISQDYTLPKRSSAVCGSNNASTKFNNDQIKNACQLINEAYLGKQVLTSKDISDKTGVSVHTIARIKMGIGWVNIAKDFQFYKDKYGTSSE